MKSILFRHPESGVENSVLIHRRTEKYEILLFSKKLASQTSQIASDFKSHDFKSRDADFKSLAMQNSQASEQPGKSHRSGGVFFEVLRYNWLHVGAKACRRVVSESQTVIWTLRQLSSYRIWQWH